MDNVTEILELLRKQADLGIQMVNGNGRAVALEQEIEATRRPLISHPLALDAVLQTARVLDIYQTTAATR